MGILLFFSFLAGFATILAPCIWPLLPIVLSASAVSGKRRPLGLTLGITTSFTVFTLSIAYLEKIFHLDANTFRLMAVIIIALLGFSMLFPSLGGRFESFISRVLSPFQRRGRNKGTGFAAGYVTGASIGLVWAPCAGPILATIATLAATQEVNGQVVLVTLAYVLGLGIPLFLFSRSGAWVFDRMRRFTKYTGRIQQAFGLVMIAAAVLVYTNYDKMIQLKVLDLFPSYGKFLSGIENNDAVARQLSRLRGEENKIMSGLPADQSGLPDLGPAPELSGIARWLNTKEALSMEKLRGKVVLVDFWTYTCINCVRTLPYVTGWYEKYKDYNFVVVGVHTPEFAFEKDTANVLNAIKQFKIHYPVAQDNDYATWQAYRNHYWPAEYLIDAKGRIRRTHFGEGEYAEAEAAIRKLLIENGAALPSLESSANESALHLDITPETYLGSNRMERFASGETVKGGRQVFTLPRDIPQNSFAFAGDWEISPESARSFANSTLELNFQAEKVFLVISPRSAGDRIRVLIDGKPVDAARSGQDVKEGSLSLDQERLYSLVDLHGKVERHQLRLEFQNDGIAVYAFTFG